MKREIAKFLLLVPISLLVLLFVAILTRKARAEVAAERIRVLPDLELTDINGEAFNAARLIPGPLLLIFFHPECDHCRYEISTLLSNDSLSCNARIILVSYAGKSEIRSFLQEFKISDTSRMHIIHDPDLKMSELFGANIIPANFIYNDSLRLVKIFKGPVKPETIMKYLYDSD